MIDVNQIVEIAKEFGGGFVAYWTHHLFHKTWHLSHRLQRLLPRRRRP